MRPHVSYCNAFLFYFVNIFTARKRSLGQGNVFTLVCHSVHRGSAQHPHGQTPLDVDPLGADPPHCRPPRMQTPPLWADQPGRPPPHPLDADPPVYVNNTCYQLSKYIGPNIGERFRIKQNVPLN